MWMDRGMKGRWVGVDGAKVGGWVKRWIVVDVRWVGSGKRMRRKMRRLLHDQAMVAGTTPSSFYPIQTPPSHQHHFTQPT